MSDQPRGEVDSSGGDAEGEPEKEVGLRERLEDLAALVAESPPQSMVLVRAEVLAQLLSHR
jgi:hypothetical protein